MLKIRFLTILLTFSMILYSGADLVTNKLNAQNIPNEVHYVKTEDNYILRIHRVPKSRASENYRGVLFLMHGLFCSSAAFIARPNKLAAYYFSKIGFDIWMGNARGNLFSQNHTTLNPNDGEFWKFSWHEIGYYDLPAMIDYILLMTNQTKLMYIGHSQGVTSAFVLLSIRTEYNDKISILHAMTLPVIMKFHAPLYPMDLVRRIDEFEDWVVNAQAQNFFQNSQRPMISTVLKMCVLPIYSSICKFVNAQILGPSRHYYDEMNYEMSDHYPGSAGYRQVIHYVQLTLTDKFIQYDHGEKRNKLIYGTTSPPEYNLNKIRTKVHVMYGSNDWLIPSKNIPLLMTKIKHAVIETSEFTDFSHNDFIYCTEILLAQRKIYEIIIKYGF